MILRRPLLIGATLFAAGCGGSRPEKAPEKAAAPPAKPVEYFHVDSATAGSLHGKVVFSGVKPARDVISMNAEAECEHAHAGHPVYDESLIAAKDGGLANAFVYIQAGLEGKTFEPAPEPLLLDQHGCMFAPHVIGIRAAQTLDVKNSDKVSHNIHPMPKNNWEWNDQQSPQSPDAHHRFARREIMIPVKCNVHSWMRAYIGVMEHPYFAVTRKDGSFDLPNVPPGDYTIAVWHEKLGDQTKPVHVAASARGVVDFTYR